MRAKIRLDTMSDIRTFVSSASTADCEVLLTDGNNLTVSAKSMLGAIYAMEWGDVYCECEKEIYHLIRDFIIEE